MDGGGGEKMKEAAGEWVLLRMTNLLMLFINSLPSSPSFCTSRTSSAQQSSYLAQSSGLQLGMLKWMTSGRRRQRRGGVQSRASEQYNTALGATNQKRYEKGTTQTSDGLTLIKTSSSHRSFSSLRPAYQLPYLIESWSHLREPSCFATSCRRMILKVKLRD